MTEITNPHDRFFRESLGRTESAKEFVRHYLPAHVVAHLQIDTLEVWRDTFVDERLRAHFSDLVFRLEQVGGGAAYIYLLFEHNFPRQGNCTGRKARPKGEPQGRGRMISPT